MALKLGKCRLCLKLGDFYSIFTVDNSLQLAEMAMNCARIKVYEGDGLPDKVCSECIQKLSSAHIFKQQCERADEELRKNYVPPPGFSITPPPSQIRQSSDSAFSNHTDLSNQTKPSSEEKVTPAKRPRKRSGESFSNASVSSIHGSTFKANTSQRKSEPSKPTKRARQDSESNSFLDDTSFQNYEPDSDSDEPVLKENQCNVCRKEFGSTKALRVHRTRMHNQDQSYDELFKKDQSLNKDQSLSEKPTPNTVSVPDVVKKATEIDEDKVACEKCGKTFKLKIMLKRHSDTCTGPPPAPLLSPKKELLVSLRHIDLPQETTDTKIPCTMCPTKFKTHDNLEKHLRVCHAAVMNKTTMNVPSRKCAVPCLFCQTPFEDYYVYVKHHYECTKKHDLTSYTCLVCNKVMGKKVAYFKHAKHIHFEPRELKQIEGQFECRKCNKKLATQEALITHLAAHMSNIDDADDTESRASTADDSASTQSFGNIAHPSNPFRCGHCDKTFVYRKSLLSHELKHSQSQTPQSQPSQPQLVVKNEFDEDASLEPVTSTNNEPDYDSESDESSQNDGDDNTCDICDQMFSHKRFLIKHKKTKHNKGSGMKRAKIQLKDCLVQCLICDINNMKVNESLEHNKIHLKANIKPRNRYTCIQCHKYFKSCSSLQNHIKIVHRLNAAQESGANDEMPNLADFCEVVVTKTEPLDAEVQSHNDSTVPKKGKKRKHSMTKPKNAEDARVDLSGFTCHVCGKKMPTMISLTRHVNWHTNVGNKVESNLECFVCQEKFRFKGHYRLHMKSHYHDTNLDPKFLTCPICGRKSKHLRAAQAHNNYHKQTRFQANDFQCSICNRVFQARKVYLSHMAIHSKRGEGINVVVGSVRATTAEFIPDGSNTCPHCGKKCDNPTNLKHHMSWHKSKTLLYGARHQCELCSMRFTNKKRMELHIREHYEDDNGEFKCGVCGKGYTDYDFMKKHEKGHNFDNQSHKDRIAKLRANKVKCPICNRYYPDLVKLIRHLRMRHPESKMIKEDPDAPAPKVYSCKLCAKTFYNEHNFKKHEEAHLRKPLHFRCKLCLKKFNSHKSHNLHVKAHMVKKYVDNPLKCEHCDEHFIRGYDLHYHLRDTHGINETWITEVGNQAPKGPLKEFQCSICHKILASRGNYGRHLDYHNSLRCNYCFDYFSSLKFLEGHQTFSCEKRKLIGDTEPHPRKIKCEVCYKPFHLQVKLDCHLRTQHGQNVFRRVTESKKETVCDYCFKLFETEAACAGHKVYHRTIYYYGCIYCDRKFNTLTLFNRHKNDHYARLNVDDPFKCDHCDEKFVPFREYIYHMREVHGDNKDWLIIPKDDIEQECHICKKTFFNLHKHLQYHEDNRCKKCSEYFFSQIDFEEHLCEVDSDDETQEVQSDVSKPKYEECTFCFKPITRTSSKLKHDLIHKASGSISCRFCSLKFKTMDAFNIHAFSHRNRKYNKKPLKCKMCGERFIKYGPFIKHLRSNHKYKLKMHYRAVVKPERCVVCGDYFPNLHNHYRAHLLNRCANCFKYFTSAKVFGLHECGKEDSDPTKVFTSDENLTQLINTYVAKDESGDENKLYGFENDDDDNEPIIEEKSQDSIEVDSQNSADAEPETYLEPLIPHSIQSPIISDVLSLYQEKKVTEEPNDVIDLSDDDVNVVLNDHGDTIILD